MDKYAQFDVCKDGAVIVLQPHPSLPREKSRREQSTEA